MNIFPRRQKPDQSEQPPQPEPVHDDEPFSTDQVRQMLWDTLTSRVGSHHAGALKQDFALHVESDAVHGLEKGYLCLIGKLIEMMDVFNSMLGGDPPQPTPEPSQESERPISPFMVYRK